VTRNVTSQTPASATPGHEWFSPPRFALVLALLIAATFPQVLLGLQTFVVRDFGFFAYPLAHFQRECFWRGELPMWNPYNNCGIPFLAQWNTMPLYPPALIYLLLPLSWSLSFFCLAHLFFAGLGMYFLAHRWTGHRLAAAVAGVAFAFNGLSLNLLMWPSHIATLSWMPWVILTVEQAWRHGGRKLLWAAVAGTLQMLAGGPETILLTWLLLAALWVGQIVGHWLARGRSAETGPAHLVWRFPLIVLIVAGLAAVQLLPFLDLAAHSQRETGYADTRWSMPGRGWANFFVPMVFGRIWTMGVFFQYDQAWTSSYYLGIGTLLLACLAVFCVRRPRVWFLGAAAALALLLALGDQTFVYRILRHWLPQLSLVTYPVKFVTVAAFGVPLLAAFAIAAYWNAEYANQNAFRKRLLLFSAVFLALIAAVLVWAWRSPFPTDNFPATLRNGLARAAFLVASTALLLIARRSLPVAWARVVPIALIVVFWLDVFTHEPTQNPTVEPWVYTPGLARARAAMQPEPALGTSRVMVSPTAEVGLTYFAMSNPGTNFLIKRLGYFADCNLLDDVPKVNGFFSLYPREGGELNSIIYGSTNVAFPRLADFMAVSHVTAAERFFDWVPRKSFLPVITAGQNPVYLEDPQALQAVLSPEFRPDEVVLLPPRARTSVTVTNRTSARVVRSRFETQRVEFDVEAAEPSLVTLSQTYYHRWRASIDGHPALLLRANYAFQALEVPTGKHTVRLSYRDEAFYAGAVISAVSLLGCVISWLRSRKIATKPR
jgi:hypothetical protein